MAYLAFFGFLCLYTDLTINQKDLLTFPNFFGYLLLGILLLILWRQNKVGKRWQIIFTFVCFVLSLFKSLQDAFHFFGAVSSTLSLILRLLEIAASILVSWFVYKTALNYAKQIKPNVLENKSAVVATIALTAFFAFISPFFSTLWEYSSYIICGLRLIIAIGLIVQVIRFLKVKKDNDKTV